MDTTSDTRESELMVMFKEPAHGEEGTSCLFAVVNTVSRGRNSGDCTYMGKVETFEVLLASTKTEGSDWHWVSCDFQQRSDAVSATGVPVAERLGSKGSVIVIGVAVGLEGVRVVVGLTSTSTVTSLTVSLGTTEVFVVLVTE